MARAVRRTPHAWFMGRLTFHPPPIPFSRRDATGDLVGERLRCHLFKPFHVFCPRGRVFFVSGVGLDGGQVDAWRKSTLCFWTEAFLNKIF